PRAIPGHNMPLFGLGIFILWLGWFGFNPGSTLNAADGRFTEVLLVTQLAACAGVLGGISTAYFQTGKIDLGMAGNGAIGRLVYTGSFHQLGAQALGIVVAFATVFALSFATFWVIKRTHGLRVTADEEDAGLDISEHGMYGYPEQFIPEPELIGYGALPADTK